MFKKIHLDVNDVGMAIVLWICSLPLIALIVTPAFGLKIAGLAAVVLMAVFLIPCWGTFRQRLFHG